VNVLAFSSPISPAWRWRIVNYAGDTVEESSGTFSTISAAVAAGREHLSQMDYDDRSVPAWPYRSTTHLRRR
jgi:hypothetical protein